MQTSLENETAALLNDLVAGQDELLEILSRSGNSWARSMSQGWRPLAPQEQQWIDTLQECLDRRQQLLARAAQEGLPSSSLQAMAERLPTAAAGLCQQVDLARRRGRLLQQESLVNWMVIQRTLLHLSQLLEIIATGGRLQPTYGERATVFPAAC